MARPESEPFVEHNLDASDPRADGRRREVHIARDRILITRRVNGVAMRITLPPSAYDGVVFAIAAPGDDGLVFVVRLKHRDPDLSIVLLRAFDEDEARRAWRLWTRDLNLPAMIEREPGVASVETSRLDGLVMGLTRGRRRGSPMTRRRPRFLVRRKTGRVERETRVTPCQREIFSGPAR